MRHLKIEFVLVAGLLGACVDETSEPTGSGAAGGESVAGRAGATHGTPGGGAGRPPTMAGAAGNAGGPPIAGGAGGAAGTSPTGGGVAGRLDGSAGNVARGGRGGAGGDGCQVFWDDETDPYHEWGYTQQSLDIYCQDGCPATLQAAIDLLTPHCRPWWPVDLVTGCGYQHVGLHGMYGEGYIFEEDTGALVGAWQYDDIERFPCNVARRYAGVMPEACFELPSGVRAGNICGGGGAGGAGESVGDGGASSAGRAGSTGSSGSVGTAGSAGSSGSGSS